MSDDKIIEKIEINDDTKLVIFRVPMRWKSFRMKEFGEKLRKAYGEMTNPRILIIREEVKVEVVSDAYIPEKTTLREEKDV